MCIHYSVYHKTKAPVFTCRFCRKELGTKFQWSYHELRHTGWRYYKCQKCDQEYSTAAGFSSHIDGLYNTGCNINAAKNMTSKERKMFFKKCRKNMELEHALILGNEINFDENYFKSKKPKYMCRFCQKEHESKLRWACHELRHTGWKYYQCLNCNHEFLEASGFANHIKGKTKTDCPGVCGMTKEETEKFRKDCRKNWKSEHARILGNVTNFDEKDFEVTKLKFKCRFCKKEHDSKFEWAYDELRHTGWKYYKCAKCGWESV